MTELAEETARLVDSLPPEKAQALMEFARFLAEKADEEEWEKRFSDPKYAGKLGSLVREVEAEIASGATEPLDPDRL
jgi:hypothetical protein